MASPHRTTAPTLAAHADAPAELLRTALAGYVADPTERDPVRHAVRAFAAVARARAQRPEQMVLRFKALWASVPELQHDDVARREHLREQLVTLCIDEYYGAGAD